jgi:iron complex outermembrane receptor protein
MTSRLTCIFISCFIFINLEAQETKRGQLSVTVSTTDKKLLPGATVELHRSADSALIKTSLTDTSGKTVFIGLSRDRYFLVISAVSFIGQYSEVVQVPDSLIIMKPVFLKQGTGMLAEVTVTGKKPLLQLMPGKTIVNVDASISNSGATILEVLEKSPGITIDKDGNISLKGKQNVLILIDGKPTYLPAADITQLLAGMNASLVDQVEIMDNPPAKYDASGNAGVINLRTKKLKQRGFNGNLGSSYGQGHYYKNNNSLSINYRHDKFNIFFTYSSAFNKGFTDLYALRTYYEANTVKPIAVLNQDTWLTSQLRNHTVRLGADYYLNKSTTIGIALSGIRMNRNGTGDATSSWLNPAGVTDSLVITKSTSSNKFLNAGGNLNFKYEFGKGREVSADIDYLDYSIQGNQFFDNIVRTPTEYTESVKGNLPSTINIFSAKADYHQQVGNTVTLDAGYKSSFVNTDNLAQYYMQDGSGWQTDYNKSNHFFYRERIHALYASSEKKFKSFTVQGGLRYENTQYNAEQKGNSQRKDSSFSRKYDGIFPTLFAEFKADSSNSFSFSAGRRIDRPAYQKLNPFVFVINKYTYQQGNPFFRPQYTWNFQLSHQFKQFLITTVNYSVTTDYFSQIFLSLPDGILVYSEGNLGRMRNVGLTVSSQFDVSAWWSISAQANLYNKKIEGVVWNERITALTQFNMNLNNQFRLGSGWSAELSGFFVTKEHELQEITDPTGQLTAGIAKQVLKNKGSVKLTLRDIFYTQAMKGDTDFEQASEYFKLTRDSRVLTIAFSYRFGKSFKSPAKRSGATEEVERVGTGN